MKIPGSGKCKRPEFEIDEELIFFRYYAKRTTGKCFKNAIFQHDARKVYWVSGLEFTSLGDSLSAIF